MKKLFIGGLMGLMLFPSLAVSVHAQTTQVDLTPSAKAELISEIKLQIQTLLVQLIGILQQQLSDLITAQGQQITQLQQGQQSIQNTVNNIQTNTAPSPTPVGGTSPSPAPSPVAVPEQITIQFTVANQVSESPFTTNWPFISFGYTTNNHAEGCPQKIQITTDNPAGFDALNADNAKDVIFPSGYLGCTGNANLLMHTPAPGTYHVTVTDLDTGVSGSGEFTILPR